MRFFWFCRCLNGKYNILSFISVSSIFSLLFYLHINGLLIDSFSSNGIAYLQASGQLYFLFSSLMIGLLIAHFYILITYSRQKEFGICSRSIVTLFAAAPLLFFLLSSFILMAISDRFSPIIYTPIFFSWMNIVFLFATERAVIDLSFDRKNIRAYSLLMESASIKSAGVVERMKLIEQAWYLLTGSSTTKDDVDIANQLKSEPKELYQTKEDANKKQLNEFGHVEDSH